MGICSVQLMPQPLGNFRTPSALNSSTRGWMIEAVASPCRISNDIRSKSVQSSLIVGNECFSRSLCRLFGGGESNKSFIFGLVHGEFKMVGVATVKKSL